MEETLFEKRINRLREYFGNSIFSYNNAYEYLSSFEDDKYLKEVTCNRNVIEHAVKIGILRYVGINQYQFS